MKKIDIWAAILGMAGVGIAVIENEQFYSSGEGKGKNESDTFCTSNLQNF